MIKAITFDFWDTIVQDDSDEPKRAAQGLPSKAEARWQLLAAEISRYYPVIEPGRIRQAFDHANARFRHHWQVEHFTPTVASRLQEAYAFLKIDLTPGFDDVVEEIEEMEVKIPPDFAPGVHEAIGALAKSYKLGLISDAIHTPGRGIRRILQAGGLLNCFSHWVFSDEAIASKPAAVVFEQASAGLDVPFTQIVHVGDRESNDVAGPLAMGMAAILYTGVIDRGSANTQATAICKNFSDLLQIIEHLNRN